MGYLRETVDAFFRDDNWNLTDALDGHTQVAAVQGDSGRWSTVVQTFEDRGVFAFYSIAPVSATAERAAAVVEFVTRANEGMITGNFEFDYDSGDVRYKTAIDLSGLSDEQLSHDGLLLHLVRQLAYTNVGTLDRYLPGLLQVMTGAVEPAEAIKAVEG